MRLKTLKSSLKTNHIDEDLPLQSRLLTLQEASKYLGISKELLLRMRKRGNSPKCTQPMGFKGKIFYTKEWLEEWLANTLNN